LFTENEKDGSLARPAGSESCAPGRGRFIRPAAAVPRTKLERAKASELEDISSEILRDARQRVASLVTLERELEDRIRARWESVEAEASRRLGKAEEEANAIRHRVEAETKEKLTKLEKEGRAAGFREGFARGRDEGYRLGMEEGRRDGEREGHEASSRQLEAEVAPAIRALGEVAAKLAEESDRLLREANDGLLHLAVEVAKKLVKREIQTTDDVAVRNVQQAIALIFRRGSLVIHVNPEDAPLVEKALAAEPRWAEGFDSIAVRPAADMDRGGCRLLSGAGVCDMTIETQLGLIEEALLGGMREPVTVQDRSTQRRQEGGPHT